MSRRIRNWTNKVIMVGTTMTRKNSVKSSWNTVPITMFVRLPIRNSIELVLATTNTLMRYGNGLILLVMANHKMIGVTVSTSTSLDVNVVRRIVRIKKFLKRTLPLFFDQRIARWEAYLKKP